jgi:hypothetical protein
MICDNPYCQHHKEVPLDYPKDTPMIRLYKESDWFEIIRHKYKDELTGKFVFLCDQCDKTIDWWENYNE